MNLEKIIIDSIDKSAKDVVNGTFKNELRFDDNELLGNAQQNAFLMNYSAILLRTYHEELQKELAKHGIDI